MNKFDELDISLEKLLNMKSGNSFTMNDRWRCTILNDDINASWKKDVNSPAIITEIYVNAKDNDEVFDGIVVVQSDMSLSHKYYAVLYIRRQTDLAWQRMFTVNSVSFD